MNRQAVPVELSEFAAIHTFTYTYTSIHTYLYTYTYTGGGSDG